MDYGLIINIAIGFSMLLTLLRLFHGNNSYEKIISFYLLFTQFILLFLNEMNKVLLNHFAYNIAKYKIVKSNNTFDFFSIVSYLNR